MTSARNGGLAVMAVGLGLLFSGDTKATDDTANTQGGQPMVTVEGKKEQARLWRVRKALLPTIRGYQADWRALSVVNDAGVDVAHPADFIRDVEVIFDELDLVVCHLWTCGQWQPAPATTL